MLCPLCVMMATMMTPAVCVCCSVQIYMYCVWSGWVIQMLLFVAVLQLSLNYLHIRYTVGVFLVIVRNSLFSLCVNVCNLKIWSIQ